MNNYDANGHKVGHSSPGFFCGMNHYDNNGHKTGYSSPGLFGGVNTYDNNGHKKHHSEKRDVYKRQQLKQCGLLM